MQGSEFMHSLKKKKKFSIELRFCWILNYWFLDKIKYNLKIILPINLVFSKNSVEYWILILKKDGFKIILCSDNKKSEKNYKRKIITNSLKVNAI